MPFFTQMEPSRRRRAGRRDRLGQPVKFSQWLRQSRRIAELMALAAAEENKIAGLKSPRMRAKYQERAARLKAAASKMQRRLEGEQWELLHDSPMQVAPGTRPSPEMMRAVAKARKKYRESNKAPDKETLL